MNQKAIIYTIVIAIVFLVVINIFFAGNKHAVVVSQNEDLTISNNHLKSENGELKVANKKLISEKDSVCNKLNNVNKQLNTIFKSTSKILPTAIAGIEDDVNLEMGWTNPDDAYERLKQKLNRPPTKDEYKKTLLTLFQKDLLYYGSDKDPYLKDKKVSESDIEEIIKIMPDEK